MMASVLKTPYDHKNVYRYIVSKKENTDALATILIPRAATHLFNLVY